jgi:hypothetical protein
LSGQGSFSVLASTGCHWAAQSDNSWITLGGNSAANSGPGSISYAVQANSGANRQGTIAVYFNDGRDQGTLYFTIVQATPLALLDLDNSRIHSAIHLSTNQHVWWYSYVGRTGSDDDLTADSGAPPAALGGALTTFSATDGYHVIYLGTDQHVYQMWALNGNGSWVYQDLTAITGGPPAAPGSALTSLFDGCQHVYYFGTDQHVYQLIYCSGGTWVDQDLTTATGGHLVGAGSGLTSLSGQYIYYVGANQNVYELRWNGSNWVEQGRTPSGGNTLAATGSALTGFLDGSGHQHLFYLGDFPYDDQVRHLFWNGSSWVNQAVGSGPIPGSALASGFDPAGCQYVFYINGGNLHLHAISQCNSGSWVDQDLSVVQSGSGLSALGPRGSLGPTVDYYIDSQDWSTQFCYAGTCN